MTQGAKTGSAGSGLKQTLMAGLGLALLAGALPAVAAPGAAPQTKPTVARTAEQVEVEAYINANSNRLMKVLGDRTLNSEARSTAFNEAMESFTDVRAVGRFVLGRYASSTSAEAFDRYSAAFRNYALAVYETRFDKYRGDRIAVTGSIVRKAGDIIVNSMVQGRANGEPDLPVAWRVLKRSNGWRVVDVEVFGVWLGIEQRAQFESLIQGANGSVEPLIQRLNNRARELRAGTASSPVTPQKS